MGHHISTVDVTVAKSMFHTVFQTNTTAFLLFVATELENLFFDIYSLQHI